MTQYHLDLNLAPDLSELVGQANIRYTNREQVPLDRVDLHLLPNLWDDGMTVSNALVAGRPVSLTILRDDIVGLPLSARCSLANRRIYRCSSARPFQAAQGWQLRGAVNQEGVWRPPTSTHSRGSR
jgi:hypothetical protein